MTQKERIYTAKLYMDRLANGMNPFDGEELTDDTVLNDVNLCRAFVLVSDILNQVIKNGYKVSATTKTRKQPFCITEAQRREILVTESPVGVNAISGRILKVLDLEVKGIPSVAITGWLESQGLLKRVTENGKTLKVATEEGNLIGIYTRDIAYGEKSYRKNIYEMNAQAFIIANLEEIAMYGA